MPAGWDLISAPRLSGVIQGLQDQRDVPKKLSFLGRTAVDYAHDEYIIARNTGRILVSDIVPDGQKAATYKMGNLALEAVNLPNIKYGYSLTQGEIKKLRTLQNRGGISNDMGVFSKWVQNMIDALLAGIRQRWETLIIGAYLDTFTYDHNGVIFTATFGTPSALKVTPSTPWATSASATPVADVLAMIDLADQQYGILYDRLTMPRADFAEMVATAEFQNKAKVVLPANLSFTNLSTQDVNAMKVLATSTLGVREIELYTGRVWTQAQNGTQSSAAILPAHKVILSSIENDNNGDVIDLANAEVTESVVAEILGANNMIGSLAGITRGPVSYATGDPAANPPGIDIWGVARSFPRKKLLQANAILTVG
jgi:hypothetical protein